jgi:hypothetical protein
VLSYSRVIILFSIFSSAYDDVLISAYYTDYHIMENAAAWLVDLLIIALYFFVNQQVWKKIVLLPSNMKV